MLILTLQTAIVSDEEHHKLGGIWHSSEDKVSSAKIHVANITDKIHDENIVFFFFLFFLGLYR